MSQYDLIPPYPQHVLKPEYQEMYDEWDDMYDGGNCSCHINPPCGCCTHEGNPLGLSEIPEAWENELIAEVRRITEQPKDSKDEP